MSFQSRALALAMVGLLAGCDDNTDHGSAINGHLALSDDKATLRVDGSPEAVISAAGDLSIDAHPLTIDNQQRALLQTYYRDVASLQDHGIETGKEGAATAGVALKSIASSIANGNSDQIDKQVNAQADKVKQAAMKICQDLADMALTQKALAQQLPAFQPYANIVAESDVRDCRKE